MSALPIDAIRVVAGRRDCYEAPAAWAVDLALYLRRAAAAVVEISASLLAILAVHWRVIGFLFVAAIFGWGLHATTVSLHAQAQAVSAMAAPARWP